MEKVAELGVRRSDVVVSLCAREGKQDLVKMIFFPSGE